MLYTRQQVASIIGNTQNILPVGPDYLKNYHLMLTRRRSERRGFCKKSTDYLKYLPKIPVILYFWFSEAMML